MVLNLDAVSLNALRQKFMKLLYKKVNPEQNHDLDLFVQARSDLSNVMPRAYMLKRTAENRLVLVRTELRFGTEWRNIQGPAAPKKVSGKNLWHMSKERRRITAKAKEAKRHLIFEEIKETQEAKSKVIHAPKKSKDSTLYEYQIWPQKRKVLQYFFKSKKQLKFDDKDVKKNSEETPRKRELDARFLENCQVPKRRLLYDN